ncbi:ABC transporter permease [Aminobacter sp. SR38]|jgi:putative spermidine/putrescine transport system permease protein|uniref:ABC transporter permease n=1 Tax=Aminobacter sp. SR38 TaxID=2774562 RepID=UPI00177EEEA0|nr:ABC transporter permease [Aminobacter sp. SR38]QOF69512.1 ABC transporter permease [Aminobacter sp. SR38]
MLSLGKSDWAGLSFNLVVIVLGCFGVTIMVAPVVVGFMMSLTAGNTIQFPPEGISLRWYENLLDPAESGRIHAAALTSLQIATLATLLSILVAVPAALGMASKEGRKYAVLEPFFMLPMVLPTLVFGIAALMFFVKLGVSPSFWLVVVGHTVIFTPLVFRTTVAVVSQLSPTLGESSMILGASRTHTLRRVTLPLIMPGILGGALLVFMSSLDNVSVSLFLADARTSVLPIRMWRMIEESLDVRVAAISGVVIAVTFLLVVIASSFGNLIPKEK